MEVTRKKENLKRDQSIFGLDVVKEVMDRSCKNLTKKNKAPKRKANGIKLIVRFSNGGSSPIMS